jgi:hypothetical protein
MKMKPPSGPKKQTQNKPNSNPIKAVPELAEALSAAEGAVEWANFTYPKGVKQKSDTGSQWLPGERLDSAKGQGLNIRWG